MFHGQVAFVTGSGSGIGRAEAILFAERGADVVVHDVDSKGAEEIARQVRAAGRRAHVIVADIADLPRMREEAKAAEQALGRIDILVNNAGISGKQLPLEDIDEAAFDRMFHVTIKGAFFLTQTVVQGMKARRAGTIINTSSDLAMLGSARMSHYASAKAAMLGLTKAWAKEFAPFGIRVNAIVPGVTDTPMPSAETKQRWAEHIPLKRVGEPREVAYAVAYLASAEAAFVTGQVLSPSGGGVIVGI
ncbi:MAG: SDR family NAD(P)-dependent oxidoreductase [Alphaproteobacteria bacterium]